MLMLCKLNDEQTIFCNQTASGDVLRLAILTGGRLGLAVRHGPKLGFPPPFASNPGLKLSGIVTTVIRDTDGCGMYAKGNV